MIDVKNCDGGKKISKIDNKKVHTLKPLTKVKNKIRQSTNGQVLRKKVPNINFDLNHIIILIIH